MHEQRKKSKHFYDFGNYELYAICRLSHNSKNELAEKLVNMDRKLIQTRK